MALGFEEHRWLRKSVSQGLLVVMHSAYGSYSIAVVEVRVGVVVGFVVAAVAMAAAIVVKVVKVVDG